MNDSELKAKVEELEELAPYVPPAVLAGRLTECVRGRLTYAGDAPETKNLAARFRAMGEGKIVRVKLHPAGPEEQEREAEIHRGTKAALESAEQLAAHRLEEIGRLEDVLREERIKHEHPAVSEHFDPGIPASAADWAAPENSVVAEEDRREDVAYAERKVPEEAKIRAFHATAEAQVEPAEDTKVCKRCEQEKPLSAFGKHNAFKDGLDNRCKPCRAQMRRTGATSPKVDAGPAAIADEAGREDVAPTLRERRMKADATKEAEREKIRQVTVFPPAVPVSEPEEIRGPVKPKAPERFCANGDKCVAHKYIGRPTKLNSGNRDPICFGCQEAGIGEKPEEKMIVRHSAVGEEAG